MFVRGLVGTYTECTRKMPEAGESVRRSRRRRASAYAVEISQLRASSIYTECVGKIPEAVESSSDSQKQ